VNFKFESYVSKKLPGFLPNPPAVASPHMNELKRKQGLKREILISFHRASLHTTFPFGKSQALATNLGDYLTSKSYPQRQSKRLLPLFKR
jgi:hypothetical protein